MHFKETVSILSLKYELNQIKNGKKIKVLITDPLDPLKRPPRGPHPLQNPIYPLFTPWTPWTPSLKKNFEILGGLFDPPSEKKVRDIYG